MRCQDCGSAAVTERPECTAQGYRRFRCHECGKQFNERSGGVLNRTQYPSDVIALVVLWRLRYKLALRDLPEMFLVRGIEFSHEAVREWEAKLTPALAEDLRRRRRGRAGCSWYVDETYIKVDGRWRYLYRAIDRSGALVDVMSASAATWRQPRRSSAWPRQSPAARRTGLRRTVTIATHALSGPNSARMFGTGPAATSTTGRNKITAASWAGTGPCVVSNVPDRPPGSAGLTMNFATFVASAPAPPTPSRQPPQIAPPPQNRDRAGHSEGGVIGRHRWFGNKGAYWHNKGAYWHES